MRRILPVLIIALLAYGYDFYRENRGLQGPGPDVTQDTPIQVAFANAQSDVQVQGAGKVVKVLRDDLEGSRHQKFILALPSGHTVLVSHNIDLAPRVDRIREGDRVEFFGEYEWNPKGGVIHWTHRDPRGRHPNGWLRHQGVTYH